MYTETLMIPSPQRTQVDYSVNIPTICSDFGEPHIFASHRHSQIPTTTTIHNPHHKLYILCMWLPVYDNKFLEYTQSTHQHHKFIEWMREIVGRLRILPRVKQSLLVFSVYLGVKCACSRLVSSAFCAGVPQKARALRRAVWCGGGLLYMW